MSPATINASESRKVCVLLSSFSVIWHAIPCRVIIIHLYFFLSFFFLLFRPFEIFLLSNTHTQRRARVQKHFVIASYFVLSHQMCAVPNISFFLWTVMMMMKKHTYELNKWNDVHDFVKGNFIWLLMKVTLLCISKSFDKSICVIWWRNVRNVKKKCSKNHFFCSPDSH